MDRPPSLLCLLALCWTISLPAHPAPDATLPDGGRYFGGMQDGLLHGDGRLEWSNGDVYEGEFENGMMSGAGRIEEAGGQVYEGKFRDGKFHGLGEVTTPGGRTYTGEFQQGQLVLGNYTDRDGTIYRGEYGDWEFHGWGRLETGTGRVWQGRFDYGRFIEGTHIDLDGSTYTGRFHEWMLHGEGSHTTSWGDSYRGRFVQGVLEGEGEHRNADGDVYRGTFEYGMYHGAGRLVYDSGAVYEGEFEYGARHGRGRLTAADGTIRKGEWRQDRLESDPDPVETTAEELLYTQPALLAESFSGLAESEPGRIDLYLLAVGGDGRQEVFRREVEYVSSRFEQRFGTGARTVTLANSRNHHGRIPLATTTSITRALAAIAERMDTERDILFVFLTSHGSEDHQLVLAQKGVQLPDLPADRLGELLSASPIRWKVVVISACYSGGFIEPLADERTLIITAADKDRQSFGCSDEADFTYFGRAFFKQALNETRDFVAAFERAAGLIRERETEEDISPPSTPQIHAPEPVVTHLRSWLEQFEDE